jgi:hypothetical protein
MEYFVSILDIVIWPSVTLLGILSFRKDIKKILSRLIRVETSTAKAIFNEELKEIQEKFSETVIDVTPENKNWIDEMNEIAHINPRAAIIEAWTAIEIACVKKGMVQGATTMKRFSPKMLEDFLDEINFSREKINKVLDLRRLRNRVAHGLDTDFDFIDAKKYIELADKTLSVIGASNK